ncbi:MAG: PIG-L family deacetylase [Candidatus Omnitrophica bacterium]|nr:PIG-L family deacetylase [Candidatus Omnitrophota bacterium]HOX54840.1 PIG-L family deacetylase [Candidatus Omnitrophota bacterium]
MINIRRKYLFLFICVQIFFSASICLAGEINHLPQFKDGDRILVFAPHPDDETIGAAGIMQEAVRLKLPLGVVYYTNGDNNEVAFIVYKKHLVFRKQAFILLGETRRKESAAAMKLLGLKDNQLVFLGYPDFGTLEIFTQYWGNTKPFKSMLTRVTHVPYKECISYDAEYVGESILYDVKKVLKDFRPTKIFVTGPVDTNKDHRSLFLFLQVALWDLEGKIPAPEVYTYLVHYPKWPLPRGSNPDLALDPPPGLANNGILWYKFDLSPDQAAKKQEMVAVYKTQNECCPKYLFSFVRKNELFANYPQIVLNEYAQGQIDWDNLKEIKVIQGEKIDEDLSGERNIESVEYVKQDGFLYVRVKLRRWVAELTGINIYLFGYNRYIPFSVMPKIRVSIAKPEGMSIHDGREPQFIPGMEFKFKGKYLILKVPLISLKDTSYILSCVTSHFKGVDYDATAWRILKIK